MAMPTSAVSWTPSPLRDGQRALAMAASGGSHESARDRQVRSDLGRHASTGSVSVERLARAGAARAATRPDAELGLQLLERAAAVVNGRGDGAVGDAVADANDHGRIVMRMIHICKP